MKEGPSGSAIRSLIPSHRKLLWSKVTVVSVHSVNSVNSDLLTDGLDDLAGAPRRDRSARAHGP
jgi:hypothetical protein